MTTLTKIQVIDRIQRDTDYLADARRVLATAEIELLRSKYRLADADRLLDELVISLTAAAPRETCTNEAQRKAFALAGSRDEADAVARLRLEHLEAEVRRVQARCLVAMAEDTRRMVETMTAVTGLPDEPYVPELPAAATRPPVPWAVE